MRNGIVFYGAVEPMNVMDLTSLGERRGRIGLGRCADVAALGIKDHWDSGGDRGDACGQRVHAGCAETLEEGRVWLVRCCNIGCLLNEARAEGESGGRLQM